MSTDNKITAEKINYLATLARIKTTDSENHQYAAQLSRIIELIGQMNQVNTDSVKPLSHPHEMKLRLRGDECTTTVRRDAYLNLAPDHARNLYRVPKVITKS